MLPSDDGKYNVSLLVDDPTWVIQYRDPNKVLYFFFLRVCVFIIISQKVEFAQKANCMYITQKLIGIFFFFLILKKE